MPSKVLTPPFPNACLHQHIQNLKVANDLLGSLFTVNQQKEVVVCFENEIDFEGKFFFSFEPFEFNKCTILS